MKAGTIIRTFESKDGREVTLRAPRWDDLDDMLEFINSLVEEGADIMIDTKQTRESEVEWLARLLTRVEKDKTKAMREIYRVLRPGGAALVGGKYLGMPDFRKVSSQTLRNDAAETGIPSIRVYDDMGQWVEIRKGIKDRGFRD